MMKQIRQGVFETNSSSTHSICIAKDVELIIPESITLCFGDFGWERDTLQSVHDKASYLYTGLMCNDRTDDLNKIINILKDRGVQCHSHEFTYSDSGYVDHSYELTEFLNAVCADEDKLMNYLFSPLSFVLTGNDNDDDDVNISVSYPHDEYYKGN